MKRFLIYGLLGMLVWAEAPPVEAAITFVGSSGDRSAEATFVDLGGGILQVSLANTYALDTVDQSHVLTAIFFSGADYLTPVSASAPGGSLFWHSHTSSAPPSSAILGREWEYLSGLVGAPGDAGAGISSSGFGVFGKGNFAPGGIMVNGSSYGLLSAGYTGSALDGLASRDYIQNSMVFQLSGFYGDVNDISHVVFQYGTSINEPSFAGLPVGAIPEANYALGSIGLVLPLLAWMMVRKPNPKIRIS